MSPSLPNGSSPSLLNGRGAEPKLLVRSPRTFLARKQNQNSSPGAPEPSLPGSRTRTPRQEPQNLPCPEAEPELLARSPRTFLARKQNQKPLSPSLVNGRSPSLSNGRGTEPDLLRQEPQNLPRQEAEPELLARSPRTFHVRKQNQNSSPGALEPPTPGAEQEENRTHSH